MFGFTDKRVLGVFGCLKIGNCFLSVGVFEYVFLRIFSKNEFSVNFSYSVKVEKVETASEWIAESQSFFLFGRA